MQHAECGADEPGRRNLGVLQSAQCQRAEDRRQSQCEQDVDRYLVLSGPAVYAFKPAAFQVRRWSSGHGPDRMAVAVPGSLMRPDVFPGGAGVPAWKLACPLSDRAVAISVAGPRKAAHHPGRERYG
jgi:hypothetical protein